MASRYAVASKPAVLEVTLEPDDEGVPVGGAA